MSRGTTEIARVVGGKPCVSRVQDTNSKMDLSEHLLLPPTLHTHADMFTKRRPLCPHDFSEVCNRPAGFFQQSSITIATNDCRCIVPQLCQGAAEEAGPRLVCKSTGIRCAPVSHEVLHLFPSLRRTQLAPSLHTHCTQFSKHNSPISSEQREFMKHLPGKQHCCIHSRLTLLLAASSPL